MSSVKESRIGPSDIAPDEQVEFERMIRGEVRPVLLTPEGDVLELPKALNDLFISVIEAMRQKQAVFLMHEDEAFTTQAAANFLGMSRQFFVGLLDQGELPFHRVGTHRRVFFQDLVKYDRKRSDLRRAALDKMTEDLVSAGVYDRYVDPTRREGE
jgi:excisionase family DNA binding protein